MNQLRTQPVNWQYSGNRDLEFWGLNLPLGIKGGGRTFRDLAHRNNASFTGFDSTIWSGTTRINGWGALSFDGSTNYAVVTDHTRFPRGASPRTISMWFNAGSFDAGTAKSLFDYQGTGGSGRRFSFFLEDNAISIGYNGHRTITPKSSLSTGTWYQLTVVVPLGAANTADVICYIDGAAQSLTDEAGASKTLNTDVSDLGIGGYSSGINLADVELDDLRISSRGFPAHQVSALYRESKAGYPNALNWVDTFSVKVPVAATGGPFPHYIRRSNVLAGGVAA